MRRYRGHPQEPIIAPRAAGAAARPRSAAAAVPAALAFRQAGDRAEEIAEDASVRPGDLLQLRYHAGGQRHGVIASIDGAGAVTLHHPARQDAPPEATALPEGAAALPYFGFGGGLRVERPATRRDFDALVTLGGTAREVHGSPVVGVAQTADLALGMTVGDHTHFAYDASLGLGPGIFLGDNLQVGATIGFGFSGITGGVLDFAWKLPTELFAVLHLTPEIRPMAYVRQSYLFSSQARQRGSSHARWGDEGEVGAGVRFSGRLDGFLYGSVREMASERYWGIGLGAIL